MSLYFYFTFSQTSNLGTKNQYFWSSTIKIVTGKFFFQGIYRLSGL